MESRNRQSRSGDESAKDAAGPGEEQGAGTRPLRQKESGRGSSSRGTRKSAAAPPVDDGGSTGAKEAGAKYSEAKDHEQVRDGDLPSATNTLERALKLLKVFYGNPKPLTHADLVRRSGFSKASVSRITATLVTLGYLDRAPDGVRLQIGVRGLRLGHKYLTNSPVPRIVKPVMQAFADRYDMSVGLAVADQLDMIYIQYVNSSNIATLRLAVGRAVPMALSSIGRAYVWAQAPESRQRLLFGIWKKGGTNGPQVVAQMERAFGDLDSHGFCIAAGEYQRDTFAISVPLSVGNPPVPMALNCGAVRSLPERAVILEEVAPALIRMAKMLTLELEGVDSSLF